MPRILILVAFASLLAGCETTPKHSPIAHVARDSQRRYEIRVDATYWTQGRGPCRLPCLIPAHIATTSWLYTDTIEGRVPASRIILTDERGETEYPVPVQRLRGEILFSHGHMHVALELAKGWYQHHYPVNGDFTLNLK